MFYTFSKCRHFTLKFPLQYVFKALICNIFIHKFILLKGYVL